MGLIITAAATLVGFVYGVVQITIYITMYHDLGGDVPGLDARGVGSIPAAS